MPGRKKAQTSQDEGTTVTGPPQTRTMMSPSESEDLYEEPVTDINNLSGMYVAGTIQTRTRRYIQSKDRSNIEIVTYTVVDNSGHRYFVDDFEPESYFDKNSFVIFNIYIKVYKKRNGEPAYSICRQKQFSPTNREETF